MAGGRLPFLAAFLLLALCLLLLLPAARAGRPVNRTLDGAVPLNTDPAGDDNGPATDLAPKVIGGHPVTSRVPYPFMALLILDGRGWCGGSMIASNLVLTARHCVEKNADPKRWIVNTHRRNVTNPKEGGIAYGVLKILQHADFDAAVLVLGKPTVRGSFSPGIVAYNRRATVPSPNGRARVIGWGEYGNGQSADVLREADLPIQSFCSGYAMICAGAWNLGNCYGDSGGPLLVWTNGTWIQVGIVSSTADSECRTVGYYIRLSTISNWLDEVVRTGGIGNMLPPAPPPAVTAGKLVGRKTTLRRSARKTAKAVPLT